ncbi:uncharacterized protein [Setaria viridis]|uniref:Uncharacterized protein n=1 Tax=Setaria viridis TaxID=4556 RepID=A0A4U6VY10_SETVI|nr:uncharacterized protein LOC117843250 isoform X1 [Setaria viridis]TKW33783.1 hypothetical protein SEVIR_2G262200v2 [Setaria viridis]
MATAADLRRVSEDELRKCDLFRCFCCWRRRCSLGIPRIGPRSEYLPANADKGRMLRRGLEGSGAPYQLYLPWGEEVKEKEDEGRRRGRTGRRRTALGGGGQGRRRERPLPTGLASATAEGSPLWSVLVGCSSSDHPSHGLRIHYFRVTGSGRVIGHNNDLLELFCGVSPIDDRHTMFPVARAAIAPADRHLYIICKHRPAAGSSSTSGQQAHEKVFPPKAFSLNTADKSLSTLPPLPFTRGSWEAISACGKLWVPVVLAKRGSYGEAWSLIVYKLIGDCWSEVNSVEFPYKHSLERGYSGTLLQGYVVLHTNILLSFSNSSFFLFKCTSGDLSRVDTNGTSQYIPITGKAVYVKLHDMIYFIRGTKLFAYKYPPKWDKLLAAPIEIGNIWPYDKEGYGFVEHVGGRMLCAVWINMHQLCGCATRHALITTFRVTGVTDEFGCFVPNGVDILHSTCRQIDMLKSNASGDTCYDTFCFLQKCQDRGAKFHPSDLSETRQFYCPQVEKFSEMLTCCREFLNGKPEPAPGVVALDFCKMATRSDFYFICQADQCSLLYQISTSGGKLTCGDEALEAVLRLDTVRFGDIGIDDLSAWYFVHRGSTLYVIPSSPECNHYVVDVERKSYRLCKSKRSKLFFSAVFRAGQYVVALCDTLQYVYILRDNLQWRRQKTASRSVDVSQKVKISGFVDLINDAFMISDFDTDEFFLFDLKRWEWFSVRSWFCFLSGRCIFAEGFIYTCSDEGLAAFELIYDDTSYWLGLPIMLDFSWKYICGNRRFLCFDSICKCEIGDTIVFCVVQGYEEAPPSTSSHTLAATTVQVKLVETARGTKVPVRVDHVDIFLSSIVEEGWILTNYAFAL